MNRNKLQQMVRAALTPATVSIEDFEKSFSVVAAMESACVTLNNHHDFFKQNRVVAAANYATRNTEVVDISTQFNLGYSAPSLESHGDYISVTDIALEGIADAVKTLAEKFKQFIKDLFKKFLGFFTSEASHVEKAVAKLEKIKEELPAEAYAIELKPAPAEQVQETSTAKHESSAPAASPEKTIDFDHHLPEAMFLALAYNRKPVSITDDSVPLSKNIPHDFHDQVSNLVQMANFDSVKSVQDDVFNVIKKYPDVDAPGAFDYYAAPLDHFKVALWALMNQHISIDDVPKGDDELYNVSILGNRLLRLEQNYAHYTTKQGPTFVKSSFFTLKQAKREVCESKPISLKDIGIRSKEDIGTIADSLIKLKTLYSKAVDGIDAADDQLEALFKQAASTHTAAVSMRVWNTTMDWLRVVQLVASASMSVVKSVTVMADHAAKSVD